MVPTAIDAYLDDIRGVVGLSTSQPCHLGKIGDASPTRGKPRTEDIGDIAHCRRLAHRARIFDVGATIRRVARELGLRVADLQPRYRPGAKCMQYGLSREQIVDLHLA